MIKAINLVSGRNKTRIHLSAPEPHPFSVFQGVILHLALAGGGGEGGVSQLLLFAPREGRAVHPWESVWLLPGQV